MHKDQRVQSLVVPHKVHGTHVIIIMNYLRLRFFQKARKIMTKKTDKTTYKPSKEEMFAMVKTDKGIIIVCGKYKVSNKIFKTWVEAENYIASKPYEIIVNVSVLFSKLNYDEKEKTTNSENAKNA